MGLYRLLEKPHPDLFGQVPALATVAVNAATDDIIPSGLATARSGDDVIEIELELGERMAAILAGISVAQINIVARKSDTLFRQPVIAAQQQDSRHSDHTVDQADALVMELHA